MISRRQIQFYRPIVNRSGYRGAVMINRVRDFEPPKIPGEIAIDGGAFDSDFTDTYFGMDIAGGAFDSTLEATLEDTTLYIEGGAFDSTLSGYFGMDIAGGAFDSTLSAVLDSTGYLAISGGAFDSTLSATLQDIGQIAISGGAFDSELSSDFGWYVTGGAFDSELSAILESPASLSIEGGAFDSTLSAYLQDVGVLAISGGAFDTYTLFMDVSGGAFDSELSATLSDDVSNAIAYSLNIDTGELTRYTNYAFIHLLSIDGKFYGLKADGLYLLEGATDAGTKINGSITLKDTDFGAFNSKRLDYVYLNSDTATTITPYVDGVKKTSHASAFGGRKTKMAMGAQGRYWQLQIDNIEQLEGIELLPQTQQRRVK